MLHFRPKNCYFGDAMPFYHDGVWHMFYLKAYLEGDLPGGKHTWEHLVSRDLVNWQEYPTVLELGSPGSPDDAACVNGCVIEPVRPASQRGELRRPGEKDGVFHLFYGGWQWKADKTIEETTCHATSSDLVHWEKDPANPIIRKDTSIYAPTHWRDPFVLWNPKRKCYWMLMGAQKKDALYYREGCVALITSPDLVTWRVQEPLFAPDMHPCMEAPDLFEFKGRWYLFCGSWRGGMIYWTCDGVEEPFHTPALNTIDDYLYYGAKTGGDEHRRISFGWLPNRKEPRDDAQFIWGGHMIMRELIQEPDGSLIVKCPDEMVADVGKALKPDFGAVTGEWHIEPSRITGKRADGLAFAVTENIPNDYFLHFTVIPRQAAYFGVCVRTDRYLKTGYYLIFERGGGQVRFARVGHNPSKAGDVKRAYAIEDGKPIDVKMFIHGTVADIFIGDRAALCYRMYDFPTGALTFFCEEGEVAFMDVKLKKI